jgi:hypothetical protein
MGLLHHLPEGRRVPPSDRKRIQAIALLPWGELLIVGTSRPTITACPISNAASRKATTTSA